MDIGKHNGPRFQTIGSFISALGNVITIEQDVTKKGSYIINDHNKNKLGHAKTELNAWSALKYASGINNFTHRSKGADDTQL